ncbi:MAG: ABC transporter ATP-binding protein [Anaerorhabdus sp.]
MENILLMENISKVYPNGVVANKKANLELKKGEIHAIVGENGAGKSTLMKILFGMENKTEGKVYFEGKEININSPIGAINKGICMVHQHFMLVPSLTVAENIVLGMEPNKGGFLDLNKAINDTNEIAKKYNFEVDAKQKVEDINVVTKQKVEILKALYRGAKLLILDEPTAVLTPQETKELFKELVVLKEQGHTIVFISHKLNEIKEICDRLTVMRKGETVGMFDISSISKEEISNLMMGEVFDWNLNKKEPSYGDVVLSVKNAIKINEQDKAVLNGVSFSLRKGEILGLVAVEGNGQSELIEGITGNKPFDDGELLIFGKQSRKKSISEIRKSGLVYIPQDRMTVGISKEMSIKENIISTFINRKGFVKNGILQDKFISKWVENKIEEFGVITKSKDSEIGSLSGGNIQKVVVAREVSNNSKIVIAEQPTRGIDIGAAKFIHNKLIELRDNGSSVLLCSADLTETLDLSDTIIVLYEGEIVAYFENVNNLTEQQLGMYMLGIKRQTKNEIEGCIYE